jgi:tetratricopeptide (TPR) repeat protein
LVEPLGESPVTAFSSVGVGMMRVLRGDTDRGLEQLRAGLRLAKQTRNLFAVLLGSWILAEYYLVTGQADAARDHLHGVFERWGVATCVAAFPRIQSTVAWAHMESGDDAGAALLLESAPASAGDDRLDALEALWVSGKLAARRERWDEAEAIFRRVVETARGVPYPFAEGRALWAWADASARRGNVEAARELLQEAVEVFRRLGDWLHERPAAAALQRLVAE